ncbi:hypothetical protein CHS0354_019152 [Potamilus streckersoni]|uniref:Uncharacterized protein n=1 Tax=Potamilus streckersoni TaxID=2493646 RepID=A0AAE0W3X2_9BIVA|nr:hypothetical protein CHS0354_019152 [Potamilus streckersoni]
MECCDSEYIVFTKKNENILNLIVSELNHVIVEAIVPTNNLLRKKDCINLRELRNQHAMRLGFLEIGNRDILRGY